MDEQMLESVPEVVDGNMVEETEKNTENTEVDIEEIRMEEDEDDEEFYEKIEAPKFIDFTKPYPFRTDDRYWFCSRVGCDRKHEEEINPEEISKNFVLRVLAARSPNIKLRKALNREHSSMKCPLSAPAKPSKPRMPRLPVVPCSISEKICDPQSKIRPCSKVGSTPVARTRQVAAKYMTTPRNKKCVPDSRSCKSVPNPKTTTTADVAKNRTIAKALFQSPKKKVISLKKSVELHTPLKKICEGMKRLEIASQKKSIIKSKYKKTETEDSSKKQVRICKSDKKSKVLAPKQEKESGKKEENLKAEETSQTLISHAFKDEINLLPNLEDKENIGSVENDQSNEDDGKENAPNPRDYNRVNNQPLGEKILGKEMHKKNKVVQPVLAKCKKPKPTNVKPFRLRTDERGILKEAILERKLNEKEVAKDTGLIKRPKPVPNNTTQRPKVSVCRVGSPVKKMRMPRQQVGVVIKEKSCKLVGDEVAQKKPRAASAPRSNTILQGKRCVTIAKEPNFHTSHLPRGCSKKIA